MDKVLINVRVLKCAYEMSSSKANVSGYRQKVVLDSIY